jgi:hypothetical protein
VYESHFDQELRDHLARRRAELGEARMSGYRAEWLALLREGRRLMLAGTPVEDPQVQEVTRRWEAMAAGLQVGDREVAEQLKGAGMALWRRAGAQLSAEISRQIDWLEADDLPAVMEYFQRARNVRQDG